MNWCPRTREHANPSIRRGPWRCGSLLPPLGCGYSGGNVFLLNSEFRLLTSFFESGKVFSQKKPEKRGAGSHKKHDDHVAFEAGGEHSVPVIRTNGAHDKTQSGQKGGQQSVRSCTVSNPLPGKANKIRRRACRDCREQPGVQRKNHVSPKTLV